MNEVIKRRLAGATVLIGIAFVGVSLLPRMNVAPTEDSVRIVVIDLGAPAPSASVPAIAATPPTLAAVDDGTAAPVEQTGSDEDSGDIADPGEAPAIEAAKPAGAPTAKPAPQPLPSAELPSPARAQAPPAAPAQRGLKLSESITVAPVRPAEAAVPAAPAPAPATPAPTAAGRWYVQVGGFADIRNAHQAQDRVRAAGQASIIAPMESAQGTLYRVRAGPFPSREAALAAQAALAGSGFNGSALIEP